MNESAVKLYTGETNRSGCNLSHERVVFSALQCNPTAQIARFLQLQNAILNLVFNARDAMPLGGVLDLSTRIIYLPQDSEK